MRLVLAILGFALASDSAFAGCVEGRWLDMRRRVVSGPRLVVSITQGTVAIEGLCPPAPVRLRGKGPRTIVRATWPSCGDIAGPLRLRAVIGRGCVRMHGVVRRRPTGPVFGFLGRRVGVCGNGIVEFGESCDDGNQGSGDCCSSTCQREPACEGGCRTNTDCAASAYCAKPVGSCGADGRCSERPEVCSRDYAPVCGCDDVTYGNECDAAAAGVTVDHTGPCREVCGTIAGIGCPQGEFCDYDPGECQTADVAGTCRPIPDGCTHQYDPVCGCDNVTYGNDCDRQAKRAQKAHDGACAK